MIITVGGSIGSGKSTLAKKIAQNYNLAYYSVGGLLREMARERGISLLEMSNIAEKDSNIDRELDERQKEWAKTDCVIDSRLGAYMVDADFSIWLDVSPKVQIQRISERDGISLQEAERNVQNRAKSEAKRYKALYGIDINDQSGYDLILDTTSLSKELMFSKCRGAIDGALL